MQKVSIEVWVMPLGSRLRNLFAATLCYKLQEVNLSWVGRGLLFASPGVDAVYSTAPSALGIKKPTPSGRGYGALRR